MAPRARPPARAEAYRLRPASAADLSSLVAHRISMWRDIRSYPEATLREHAPEYLRWIRPRLKDGRVVAWIAETADGAVAASGALWFQPSIPRPGMPQLTSPYVFTMYTDPAHRGRGLATRIMRAMIAASRTSGHPRLLLNASIQGRPLYRRLGFERTWEMRYWLDPRQEQIPRKRAPKRPPRRNRVAARAR